MKDAFDDDQDRLSRLGWRGEERRIKMNEQQSKDTYADLDHGPGRNMYGCLPCPKCRSAYRVGYKRPEGLMIECDDCGFKEPAVDKR